MWSDDLWSPASAQIHGIPRDRLDSAFPAKVIAAEFVELISDRVIVSDAPEFDGRWLDMLAATIGCRSRFEILDFDAAIAPFGFEGVKRAYAFLDKSPAPHREGKDAARLAKAWLCASRDCR